MIAGRTDTWLTIPEFAAMVGRSPKTVQNWAAEGRIQFVYLCGMPLVALSMIESLITGNAPVTERPETLALELMGRMASDGSRVVPEKRNRGNGVATDRESPLSVTALPETPS